MYDSLTLIDINLWLEFCGDTEVDPEGFVGVRSGVNRGRVRGRGPCP